jgi:hypothetical protein
VQIPLPLPTPLIAPHCLASFFCSTLLIEEV